MSTLKRLSLKFPTVRGTNADEPSGVVCAGAEYFSSISIPSLNYLKACLWKGVNTT